MRSDPMTRPHEERRRQTRVSRTVMASRVISSACTVCQSLQFKLTALRHMLRSELPARIPKISLASSFLSICVKCVAPGGKLEQMDGLIKPANETAAAEVAGITDVLSRLGTRKTAE